MPYGEYIYTEIEAPEGYNIDNTPHRITIDVETVELKISNEKMIDVFTGDIMISLILPILGLSIFGIIYIVFKKKIFNR